MIYVASPYSHPNSFVRHKRFVAACAATAHLLRAGLNVFSPIAHSHPLVPFGLPTEWDFWERLDRDFLARCDALIVLKLDGWKESKGVAAEIGIAHELGKPVFFLSPELPADEVDAICKSKS